jgi:uncharacterized protein YjdB
MAKFLRCFPLVILGVLTACGGGGISNSNTTPGSHANAVLQSIQVSAPNPSVTAGMTQQFTATGSYDDGSTKDLTKSASWSSSDSSVATIATNGVAKGLSPGSCMITASQASLTGTVKVTVAPPALVSIAVSSASSSIAAGLTDQFTATGTYSDGSSQNLSNSATWTVSNSAVATISTGGLATTKTTGSVVITAAQGSISGTSKLTVAAPSLVSIAVGSATPSVAAGLTDQFTATGTYSDGSSQNLGSSVTWSVSNSAVAAISSGGLVTGKSNGTTIISAAQGTISGTASLTVMPPVLLSIAVKSANASVAAGLTDQFTATGTYSDGSSQNLGSSATWSISNSAVATISVSGLATAKSHGSAVITAAQGSISGTAGLTVLAPVLTSITVAPASPSVAAGLTDQFTATGTYSDGSSQNLSGSVTWSTSNSTIATISNSGVATAKLSGSAVITATQGTVSGTSPLTVGPALLVSISVSSASSSVGVGSTDQFTATGNYSDGSSQNLSSSVMWSVSNSTLAAISNSGLLNAKSNGSAIITAASGSISGTAPLTITISLASIAVTPSSKTIAPGTAQQFKATGTFSDGSTQDVTATVNWTSSDTTKATIGSSGPTSGLALAVHAGSSTITASSGTIAGSATLAVSNVNLTSILVTPAMNTIPLGIIQQFTAKGTFSDGTSQDITNTVNWNSSQPTVASITVSGAATARNLGTVSITASSGAVVGGTLLTVNAANLVSLSIQPTSLTLAQGTTGKLTAVGVFNDGSTRDVSAQASWTSSSLGAPVQANGKIQAVNPGLAAITATLGSQTAYGNVNVTNATIVSISVTPSISSIAPGTQMTFAATGQFSDSSTQVITSNVTWASSDNTLATISNAAATRGIASAVATGSVTINATFGAVTGAGQLNVSAANLTGIAVTPASAIIAPASGQQYRVTASYDDGTTQNVSSLANWSSSSTSIATVTQYGQITGQSAGVATITASYGGFTTTASVLVESSPLTSISVNPLSTSVPQQIIASFTAIGSFADGSSQDLTGAVTWTSSNSSVATVSDATSTRGQATGITPGTSTISAVFGGQVGMATLTVTNATLTGLSISPTSGNIALGTAQTYVATGTFSDGTTANLSTQAIWSSSNTNVAVMNTWGVATSASSGTTTITASLNGVSATAILTVN